MLSGDDTSPDQVFVKLATLFSDKVAFGSYVGTSSVPNVSYGNIGYSDWESKIVGFEPKVVILHSYREDKVSGTLPFNLYNGIFGNGFALGSDLWESTGDFSCAEITADGFQVRNVKYVSPGGNPNAYYAASTNVANITYYYVALA